MDSRSEVSLPVVDLPNGLSPFFTLKNSEFAK